MNTLISSLTGVSPLWPCRLCLRKPDGDITTWSHLDRTLTIHGMKSTTTLRNIINTLLNKQINNDGLPQNVCDGCVDSAVWFLLFRNLCEESEKQWTNLAHITNNLFEAIAAHHKSEIKLDDYKEINSMICIINDGKCEKTILPNKMTKSTVIEYINVSKDELKFEFDNDTLDVAFEYDDCAKKVKKRKKRENGYNINQHYECEKCHQTFTTSGNLRRHLLVRHDTVYSCEACARKFASGESLRRHFEQCRNAKCCCETCHKVFDTLDDLQAHAPLCQNQSHKCSKSDDQSWTDEHFIGHRFRHTCDVCDKQFDSVYNLRLHLRAVHKCNIAVRPYSKIAPTKNERVERNTDGSGYVCIYCNKKYTRKLRFIHHLRNHEYCSMCERCGRVLKNKQQLREHSCQKERKPQTPKVILPPELAKFTCDHCGRKYHNKGTLGHHIKYYHMFPKRFQCFICNKRFSTNTSLKGHQVVHTKERKFKCDICENVFVTKPALLYHERLHTGERPYTCDQCGEKFLSASRRMSHIRTKHWGRIEECSVCSAKFHTPYALRNHAARHSNPNSKLFCGKT